MLVNQREDRERSDAPPLQLNKGGVIKDRYNAELDELRHIAYSGKDYLLQIQQQESEKTGIPSLKIGYNNVFGYYIEVRNTHKDKVPEEWIRKQTLVNAERYITQELKEYEEKILGAEDKILILEAQLFTELVQAVGDFIPAIQVNATQLARIDCLLSFANVAKETFVQTSATTMCWISVKEDILSLKSNCLLERDTSLMMWNSTVIVSKSSSLLVPIWLVRVPCFVRQLLSH